MMRDNNKSRTGKNVFSKILTVLIVLALVLSGAPGFATGGAKKVYAAATASTWAELKEAIENGDADEVVISGTIGADNTIIVPDGRSVTITGNGTIYQKKRTDGQYQTMFQVSGNLTLGSGVTLSGKQTTCSSGQAGVVDIVPGTHKLEEYAKTVPGTHQLSEYFKPGTHQLSEYRQGTGETRYLALNYVGGMESNNLMSTTDDSKAESQAGKYISIEGNKIVIEKPNENKKTLAAPNTYTLNFQDNPLPSQLATVDSSNRITAVWQNITYYAKASGDGFSFVTDSSDANVIVLESGSPLSFTIGEVYWVINGQRYDDPQSAQGAVDDFNNTTAGGAHWEVNGTTYTNQQQAEDAVAEYNKTPEGGATTNWEIPKNSGKIYTTKDTATDALTAYNNTPDGGAYWTVDGKGHFDTEEAAQEAAQPQQGCDENADCPTADKIYTDSNFGSGSASAPKGFFIQVESGAKAVLDGATLENFITDGTVKWAAPVVANGGTFNIARDSKIQHNAVGYNADDSKGKESADKIKKYVEKNLDRTDSAGGVIYVNNAQGTISGGSIENNRGDAGGIAVRGEGSLVDFTGGEINKNVGIHYGGGAYIHLGGSLFMSGTAKFTSNYAWDRGGAVYVSSQDYPTSTMWPVVTPDISVPATFVMDGGTISDNYSVNRAGAVFVESNNVMLKSGVIAENYCRSLGGGIYVVGDGDERMYQLYIPSACITGNKAVETSGANALNKMIASAEGCDFENDLQNETLQGDLVDFKNHEGFGGGLWLCAFGGNATFGTGVDAQGTIANVIIHGNTAGNKKGQDLHLRPTRPGAGSAINVLNNYGSDKWVNEKDGIVIELNKVYSGPLNVTNSADGQGCDGTLSITGNTARIGGGIASNGTVIFGPAKDIYRVHSSVEVEKEWTTADGLTKDIKLQLAVKNPDDKEVYKLEGYSVILNGTKDTFNDEMAPEEGGDTYNNESVVYESDPWKASFGLPLTYTTNTGIKPILLFEDPDNAGQTLDPSDLDHLERIYTLVEEKRITKVSPVVSLVVKETIDGEEPKEYAYTQKELVFDVDASADDSRTLSTTEYKDRSGNVIGTVKTNKLSLKFSKGVRNEEPEIEKYVNEAVHKDVNLDEVFKYDIMAYVTSDADKVVITDLLDDKLEFVSGETDVTVLDMGPINNHKPTNNISSDKINDDASVALKVGEKYTYTDGGEQKEFTVSEVTDEVAKKVVIDGNELTVTLDDGVEVIEGEIERESEVVKNLRGHWIKISFEAKFKEGTQIKKLTFTAINDSAEEEDRAKPNVGNDPVVSDEDHEGIINNASYEIFVENEAKYEDESNTVTVKPDEPEVEKYVNKAVHKNIRVDEIFTYDIIGYVTHDADKVVFTDELVGCLELVNVDAIRVESLAANNHKPTNDISGNQINDDASVAEPGTDIKGEDGVTVDAKNDDDGSKLIVTIDDGVDPGTSERDADTVKNLRGKYVRVTFQAQIKKVLQDQIKAGEMTIDELLAMEGCKAEIKEDENTPVLSNEAHGGIKNKAEMSIEVKNEGKYNLETNTVTVKPEEPEIEKYVNEAVHEYIGLTDTFTYDIMAYVTSDADKVTITDPLDEQLQFVSTVDDVKVVDMGESNNHKPTNNIYSEKVNGDATVAGAGESITGDALAVTIDGNTLTVALDDKVKVDQDTGAVLRQFTTVEGLRGHWIKVTFQAKVKDGLTVDDLEFTKVDPEAAEERAMPNVGNAPVMSTEAHDGICNKASYEIEVKNEPAYEDESNTVTVKPEEPEIEKYVHQAVHQYVGLDEVFTYDILAYVTDDADKVIVEDELNENLEFVSTPKTLVVADMGTENNHKVTNDIDSEQVNDDATVAGEGTKLATPDDYTAEIKGNLLTVTLDDEVKVDAKTGTVTRGKHVVEGLRGHWIKITFEAKFKEGTDPFKLELTEIAADENDPVISEQAHAGVPNKAKYTIEVKNKAKYEDESNTVTVRPEKPEIEKYVNQAVHQDILLEDEFTYDIIAYITNDADSATITDELDKQLQFVSTKDEVQVVDLGTENNHKVTNNIASEEVNKDATVAEEGEAIEAEVTIDGQKLTVDIADAKALRGHWVKVTFVSKIKDGLFEEDLKYTAIDPKAEEDRDAPNVGNDPVISDEAHEGVPNAASYEIKVRNEAKYSDKSNTVTVKPEKPDSPGDDVEIEKYINQAVHSDITIDEVFTYDIIAFITSDADGSTITDTLDKQLQFVSTKSDVKVVDLGEENNHKVTNSIGGVKVNDDATVAGSGDAVKANVTISGQTLTVEIPDATPHRGHWVKVTFTAKIKDGLTKEDLKYTAIDPTAVESDRAEPNVGNAPVDTTEAHKGVPNNASYTIRVGNEAAAYGDKSNTVTVKPDKSDKPDDDDKDSEKDKKDDDTKPDNEKPDNKKPLTPSKKKAAKTGDDFNSGLWFALLGAAAAGAVLALRKRRRGAK